MREKSRRICSLLLAIVVAGALICGAAAPVHAVVLDPVAWLYPIWQAYGAQAGVTVTTMGGDEFTQDAFTGLYNEWQSFEVSSGNQQTALTISQMVSNLTSFVDIGAAVTSGNVLGTVLRLGSGIVEPLTRFWNWLIVEKLGGSAVDSVNFDSSEGNIALGSSLIRVPENLGVPTVNTAQSWYGNSLQAGGNTSGGLFGFGLSGNSSSPLYCLGYYKAGYYYYTVIFSESSFSGPFGVSYYSNSWHVTEYYAVAYNNGEWFWPWPLGSGPQTSSSNLNPDLPIYTTSSDVYSAIRDFIQNGSSDAGSITVSPSSGVAALGFDDAAAAGYTPADTNIGWNVPYDQTKDTNAYLDEAYQMALDNELTDTDVQSGEVSGTDTVGPVSDYIVPGLGDVFPFCLPFDVYNFLSALAADPVAPSFSATLAFPEALGGDQTIELDFDNETWNTLASILRMMELLAFIVGLAFVTRSMFIRG